MPSNISTTIIAMKNVATVASGLCVMSAMATVMMIAIADFQNMFFLLFVVQDAEGAVGVTTSN